jgi:hypothetical protein
MFNTDTKYRPYFTSYAQFEQPTKNLMKLISRKFDLSRPVDIQMFEIRDENGYCQYHRSKRHSTENYLQLHDILEKIARQGHLTQYITPEFYRKKNFGTMEKIESIVMRSQRKSMTMLSGLTIGAHIMKIVEITVTHRQPDNLLPRLM